MFLLKRLLFSDTSELNLEEDGNDGLESEEDDVINKSMDWGGFCT